jgi:hypothetical protein
MTYRLPSKELEHLFQLYLQVTAAYNQFAHYYGIIANSPGIFDSQVANIVKEALFRSEILRYRVWHKLIEQQNFDSNKHARFV